MIDKDATEPKNIICTTCNDIIVGDLWIENEDGQYYHEDTLDCIRILQDSCNKLRKQLKNAEMGAEESKARESALRIKFDELAKSESNKALRFKLSIAKNLFQEIEKYISPLLRRHTDICDEMWRENLEDADSIAIEIVRRLHVLNLSDRITTFLKDK